jgi:hypothetical protein
LAQALIQVAAAFVPFQPELEQALGVVLTAVPVWLVPNKPPLSAITPPLATEAVAQAAKPKDDGLVAHSPVLVAVAALVLGMLVASCASVFSGDELADRVVGPDCDPQSRALRARLITNGLARTYPDIDARSLDVGVVAMEQAAAAGQPIAGSALVFQAALADAIGPVLFEAGLTGEPVWLGLARLPPLAAEFLHIRGQLAAVCSGSFA